MASKRNIIRPNCLRTVGLKSRRPLCRKKSKFWSQPWPSVWESTSPISRRLFTTISRGRWSHIYRKSVVPAEIISRPIHTFFCKIMTTIPREIACFRRSLRDRRSRIFLRRWKIWFGCKSNGSSVWGLKWNKKCVSRTKVGKLISIWIWIDRPRNRSANLVRAKVVKGSVRKSRPSCPSKAAKSSPNQSWASAKNAALLSSHMTLTKRSNHQNSTPKKTSCRLPRTLRKSVNFHFKRTSSSKSYSSPTEHYKPFSWKSKKSSRRTTNHIITTFSSSYPSHPVYATSRALKSP